MDTLPEEGQVLKLPPYIIPTRGIVVAIQTYQRLDPVGPPETIVTMHFEVGGIGMRDIGIPLEDLEPVE